MLGFRAEGKEREKTDLRIERKKGRFGLFEDLAIGTRNVKNLAEVFDASDAPHTHTRTRQPRSTKEGFNAEREREREF